ncbi:MAG: class I SAM-dependent DNA methyltransferase [Pirellulaceae bacterium]
MNDSFSNVYDDKQRADAYSKLEFPGTYYLAFRDLPEIIGKQATGSSALDFGCGTGRSTRFLRNLGFETVGVDISAEMVARARELDDQGEYLVIGEGDLEILETRMFDVVLSAFTFDNIPSREQKTKCLQSLHQVLKDDGCIINLVSSPEIYIHEWASFSTKDFPENQLAASGDTVQIIMLDVDDRRPVEDVLWTDQAYREVFDIAGLKPVATCRPLGKESEPFDWVNETNIAPWTIYVLKRTTAG